MEKDAEDQKQKKIVFFCWSVLDSVYQPLIPLLKEKHGFSVILIIFNEERRKKFIHLIDADDEIVTLTELEKSYTSAGLGDSRKTGGSEIEYNYNLSILRDVIQLDRNFATSFWGHLPFSASTATNDRDIDEAYRESISWFEIAQNYLSQRNQQLFACGH